MAESMHEEPALAEKIWAGDTTALREARRRYEESPTAQFVPYISTLYSFRDQRPDCVMELQELVPEMQRWANPDYLVGHSGGYAQAADRADVLSTILAWIPVSPDLHAVLLDTAAYIAETGLGWARAHCPAGHHTPVLLELTLVGLKLNVRGCFGHEPLQEITRLVGTVNDPNQRSRAYRKLGALWILYARMSHMPRYYLRGAFFIGRSLAVRGVPWDVHRKTIKALLGRM